MFIQTEETPNPLVLKFLPGRPVMGDRDPLEFCTESEAAQTPLASKLFHIQGIASLFFGSDFVSVTKNPKISWSEIKPDIFGTLVDYFTLHETVAVDAGNETDTDPIDMDDLSQIEKEIKSLIDERIRPAVAMDGGDILFDRFEAGIVFLKMRGACSGCPSASSTLKSGIENMLKHYIPEVKEVRDAGQVDPFSDALLSPVSTSSEV